MSLLTETYSQILGIQQKIHKVNSHIDDLTKELVRMIKYISPQLTACLRLLCHHQKYSTLNNHQGILPSYLFEEYFYIQYHSLLIFLSNNFARKNHRCMRILHYIVWRDQQDIFLFLLYTYHFQGCQCLRN